MDSSKDIKKTYKNKSKTVHSLSALDTLLNSLRKKGITAILAMDKKAQLTLSDWAHDLVNQYDTVLKNYPMKIKDISKLPCSKLDAKLAIKLLLMASIKKEIEDGTIVELKNKFISLGSFQFIDKQDLLKLTNVASFPELNKYMNLIISEQKALLHEINGFIEDIGKIKKV